MDDDFFYGNFGGNVLSFCATLGICAEWNRAIARFSGERPGALFPLFYSLRAENTSY